MIVSVVGIGPMPGMSPKTPRSNATSIGRRSCDPCISTLKDGMRYERAVSMSWSALSTCSAAFATLRLLASPRAIASSSDSVCADEEAADSVVRPAKMSASGRCFMMSGLPSSAVHRQGNWCASRCGGAASGGNALKTQGVTRRQPNGYRLSIDRSPACKVRIDLQTADGCSNDWRILPRRKGMRPQTNIDTFIAAYPPEVRVLIGATRKVLAEAFPGAAETLDESARLLGYSYGPGYKGVVCTLILSRTGVKIGVVRGSELPDPKGLLEGSGKVHRHVALKSPTDLKRPGLKPLLKAALAAWKARNA